MIGVFGGIVTSLVVLLTATAVQEMTPDELIERYFDAIGGEERVRALSGLEKHGTYVYNGHEHPIVSYHAPGRRSREEIQGLQLWGAGVLEGATVLRGTDGRVVWLIDESREPRWLEIPRERAILTLDDADLAGSLLDYESKGHQVQLDGEGELDGTPVYRLTLTHASGLEQTFMFDKESFLLVGKRLNEDGMERELERPRAWFFDEYREVGGVLIPHWIYIEEGLFSREYIFDSIEAAEVDDALFEPPEGAATSEPQS